MATGILEEGLHPGRFLRDPQRQVVAVIKPAGSPHSGVAPSATV